MSLPNMLVGNGAAAKVLPDSWLKTPYACPICKKPLYYIADRSGATVWCPWPVFTDSEGRNCSEALGHGITLEKAVKVLMAKMGFGKYEVEVVDTPEEPTADANNTTEKPAAKKRGRKKKGAKDEPMTIPIGEFTMKDFCTLNNTYPVKALAFIKTVETIKELPSRSSGRGKPAKVWINKA